MLTNREYLLLKIGVRTKVIFGRQVGKEHGEGAGFSSRRNRVDYIENITKIVWEYVEGGGDHTTFNK